jgi:hypothetical protein
VIQEGFNFSSPEQGRMALVMEQDVLANPVSVGLLGALAEMTATADDRDLIKQARGLTP